MLSRHVCYSVALLCLLSGVVPLRAAKYDELRILRNTIARYEWKHIANTTLAGEQQLALRKLEQYAEKAASVEEQSQAYLLLWSIYLFGRYYEKNEIKASAYLEKAVALNTKTALLIAAQYYASRGKALDNRSDFDTAIALFERLGERGYTDAYAMIAGWYNQLQQPKAAFQAFLKGAQAGNASAMCTLGHYYETGKGVPVDVQKAYKWYKKSADLGYHIAYYNLGTCYEYGVAVPEDIATAIWWYEKAACEFYAPAYTSLGALYFFGEKVTQDFDKAISFLQRAAQLGCKQAQRILAYIKEYIANEEQS